MSLKDTRHIRFLEGSESHLVPAQSHVEWLKGRLKVRFIFQKDDALTGIDEVVVDNADGNIRMVTSKGKEFTAGPLFDQLYVWYDYIVKR